MSSSDTSGTIDPAGMKTAVFTNKVSNDEKFANVSIAALKTLDGEPATDGAFKFTLAADDGAPMSNGAASGSLTVANGAGGAVNFGSITYDKAGTYCYTIGEVKGDDDGVTYDGKTVDVTVEVKAADDGSLSADVTYDGKSSLPVFANKTKTVEPHYGSLTFTKKVEGAPESDAGRKFKFRVDWDSARDGEEFALAAGESKTWKDLEPGLGYTITELDVPAGYKASGKVTGSIEADSEAMASITNTYTVKPKGSFTVSAKKKLEGRELKAGEHRYRIREKAGSAAGITYDKRAYDLTVTARASQADDSKLECAVAYIGTDAAAEPPVFTNSYEAKGTFAAHATKSVKGADLKKDAYTFELLEVETDGSDGEVVATAKNDAEGNVTFGDVTVTSLARSPATRPAWPTTPRRAT